MKYIQPITTIFDSINYNHILCVSQSTTHSTYKYTECNNQCELWHTCRDRQQGKFCADKMKIRNIWG